MGYQIKLDQAMYFSCLRYDYDFTKSATADSDNYRST